MATKNFTQFNTATPLTTSDYIVGYKADGTAEIKTQVQDIINLVGESDSQTLSFNETNKELTISSGNTISLSSLSDTAFANVSSSFATNTNLNAVSSLLTPLTLTNTLTSQLVTNTAFANYQTSVTNSTATLLPTTIYQNTSGSFATNSFVQTNFFPLSGGTISGATRINNDLTVFGNLTATGTTTFANTVFTTTSSLSVVHIGAGPALWVGNNGTGDIASFYDIDQNVEILHVGGNNGTFPNVGVKTSQPNKTFTVAGDISASDKIFASFIEPDTTLTIAGNISGNNLRTSFNQGLATGNYSFAEGYDTQAIGGYSHAEGLQTVALGNGAHAEGYQTSTGREVPLASYDQATRTFTFSPTNSANFSYVSPGVMIGGYSYISGNANNITFTVASRDSVTGAISATEDVVGANATGGSLYAFVNNFGHAEGYKTQAYGQNSHAQGNFTIAEGNISHAEGSLTIARGTADHAQGDRTETAETGSFAFGGSTKALGNWTTVGGYYASSDHRGCFVWRGSEIPDLGYSVKSTRNGQFLLSAEGGIALHNRVGIGTDSIARALTVIGDISATGNIFGANTGGGGGTGIDTGVRALTGNWESTYTTVRTVSAPNIQVFTSSGTWTKPAGAVRAQVILIGGGGGGGSGRSGVNTVVRTGGGGGAGGAYQTTMFDAAILSATVLVTVGTGGVGPPGFVNVNGNPGGNGGSTSFGNYSIANGGTGGPGGTASAQSGAAGGTISGSGFGVAGGTGGATTTTDGGNGGDTTVSAPGGGAGGSLTAANARRRGGDGGINTSNGLARALGGLTTDALPGSGAVGASVAALTRIPGQGGGGGCAQTSGQGGSGGNGGAYGAGGGGGGGGADGLPAGGGGTGADGFAAIITYFI